MLVQAFLYVVTTVSIMPSTSHANHYYNLVDGIYERNRAQYKETQVRFTKLQFAQLYYTDIPVRIGDKLASDHIGLKLFIGYECLKQTYRQSEKHALMYDRILAIFPEGCDTLERCDKWMPSSEQEIQTIINSEANAADASLNWLFQNNSEDNNDTDQEDSLDMLSPGLNHLMKKMTGNVKQFIEKESGYEGIGTSSDSLSISDNSAEDFEVLDTIYRDPDLLMKLLEKSQDYELEYKSTLKKLQDMKACDHSLPLSDNIEDSYDLNEWSTEEDDDKIEEYFKSKEQQIESMFIQRGIKKRMNTSDGNDNISLTKAQLSIMDSDEEGVNKDIL